MLGLGKNILKSGQTPPDTSKFFTYVNSLCENLGATGGSTSALDTSTADLIVVSIVFYSTFSRPTPANFTDNKGNLFTALPYYEGNGTAAGQRLFYCLNPVVGSGHVFTYAEASSYPTISILAVKSSSGSPSLSGQNGHNDGNVTTTQTGNITPARYNNLFVCGVNFFLGRLPSVDSGFTLFGQKDYSGGVNFGNAAAYKIQVGKNSENPAFSWTSGASDTAVSIASFNP